MVKCADRMVELLGEGGKVDLLGKPEEVEETYAQNEEENALLRAQGGARTLLLLDDQVDMTSRGLRRKMEKELGWFTIVLVVC